MQDKLEAEVNRIALLLKATWERVDPNSDVAKYPASYVATFADMARAVVEDRAALTPPVDSGEFVMVRELDRRRVLTLAKLVPMLSLMAGGEAAEVIGFNAADLYNEAIMALSIEDEDSPDIMAAVIVEMNGESGHGITDRLAASPHSDGGEPFGYWVEQKHADPVLLRKPAYIPEPSELRTVTPLFAASPSRPSPSPEQALIRDLAEEPFGGEVWERSRKLEEYSQRAAALSK